MALAALAFGACSSVCEPARGVICTIAGTGQLDSDISEGPASQASLYFPLDMTVGPDGQLYLFNISSFKIWVITHDGFIRTVAGSGRLGDGLSGPAEQVDLNRPTSIVFDERGRLVFSDWFNGRIKRVDLATGMLETLYGTGNRGYRGDGGPAADADMDLPGSLAYDAGGNLFIMDQRNQAIRKVDGSGVITHVAGRCIVGECIPGEEPTTCEDSHRSTCGDEITCFGPCAGAYGGDGGPASEARIAQPIGPTALPAGRMAFDADGNLYFADTRNQRIRRIDTDGIITTVAGSGVQGLSEDGVPALEAAFHEPMDIAIGSDGTLYFTDTMNSCVRAIGADGRLRTVAGVCGQRGYSGDGGPATEALLDQPLGIELGRDDTLYIADTRNHRIRAVGL